MTRNVTSPVTDRRCAEQSCQRSISHLHTLSKYCLGGACKQKAYRRRNPPKHIIVRLNDEGEEHEEEPSAWYTTGKVVNTYFSDGIWMVHFEDKKFFEIVADSAPQARTKARWLRAKKVKS